LTTSHSHPISPRRKERILVFQALFMMDVGKATLDEAISNVRSLDMDPSAWAYVEGTIRGIVADLDQIDEAIRVQLQNWSWERLARVDRNLMRIATYEMAHSRDLPFHVFISEAIDLAKEYGDDSSGGFINGVLDAIWRSRQAQTPKST
jgi:N utilization substance protein B